MNSDTKPHATIFSSSLIGPTDYILDFDCTFHRIDHTRELRQHTVARRVRYTAPVLAYEPVHNFPVSRECPQRSDFVLAHEPRATRHVSREDGCEFTFDWLGGRRHNGASEA